MNIFVLSCNPKLAAQYHCDRHVTKMCLEYAQILSTVLHQHDAKAAEQVGAYRPTHAHHPCTLWASRTSGNAEWLGRLLIELGEEHVRRFGTQHSSVAVGRRAVRALHRVMNVGDLTPFAQAMPEQYRHRSAVHAYRSYYIGEKARFATWKLQRPKWWIVETCR